MGIYKKRKNGEEQPSIMGPLKLRLPFVHYKFEFPDAIQGAILCVVPMGVTAIMMDVLGIPFELAIAFVILNNFMYLFHSHLGDPSLAGWITAGIPLYVTFLLGFPEGEARILALIALQFMVALIFLGMGLFRGANFLVEKVPTSLKAGILLGAGFSAIYGEFQAEGRVWEMPWTILIGAAFAFFMLFSKTAAPLREKYRFFRFVAQFGIAIPFALSYLLGLLIGEVSSPSISWSNVPIPLGEMVANYSIFGLGLPPLSYFLQALPLAIASYIIAFGDILVANSMVEQSNQVRKDEKVRFEPTRNSVITGSRNLLQSIFTPFIALSGPQWTAGQALVTTRHINNSRRVVDSYWGGANSLYWGMSIALILGPVVSLFQPGVSIGMALTMLIQGYLCGYLAMNLLKDSSNLQKGIAIIVGTVLASQGASWGLAAGILLWLILEVDWTNIRKKDNQKTEAEEKAV